MGAHESKATDAMRFYGVGLSFFIEVGVFTALGWWIDGKLGTEPWLLVAGCVIGMIWALKTLLRRVEVWERNQLQHRSGSGSDSERDKA